MSLVIFLFSGQKLKTQIEIQNGEIKKDDDSPPLVKKQPPKSVVDIEDAIPNGTPELNNADRVLDKTRWVLPTPLHSSILHAGVSLWRHRAGRNSNGFGPDGSRTYSFARSLGYSALDFTVNTPEGSYRFKAKICRPGNHGDQPLRACFTVLLSSILNYQGFHEIPEEQQGVPPGQTQNEWLEGNLQQEVARPEGPGSKVVELDLFSVWSISPIPKLHSPNFLKRSV